MQSRAELLAQSVANEATLLELRWRIARASRVITAVLCATDEPLAGARFQAVHAVVRAILDGSLPPGPQPGPSEG
jgi:hypothetical protein